MIGGLVSREVTVMALTSVAFAAGVGLLLLGYPRSRGVPATAMTGSRRGCGAPSCPRLTGPDDVRRAARSPDRVSSEQAAQGSGVRVDGTGYYVATLDAQRRRVRSGGLLARGNGVWTVDGSGLSFLRYLTRRPIRIPRSALRSVRPSDSAWWGGRWVGKARVIEIEWVAADGSTLVSGFVFPRDAATRDAVIDSLTR